MTALTKDRNTEFKSPGYLGPFKLAASTTVFNGALVAVNTAGHLVPASNTAGLRVVGVADEQVINSGSAGDESAKVRQGIFGFANSGTNACEQADIGRPVFVEDDQTVCDVASNGIIAGILLEIDSAGVCWVAVFPDMAPAIEMGIQTVSAAGAISPYTRTTLVAITGTMAFTLAAGLYEGQRKSIRVITAASTPDGTLTPATFADGTSIDLDAVNESVELEWHATGGWRVVSIVGATITA